MECCADDNFGKGGAWAHGKSCFGGGAYEQLHKKCSAINNCRKAGAERPCHAWVVKTNQNATAAGNGGEI